MKRLVKASEYVDTPIGRIVRNDGNEIVNLLSKYYPMSHLEHIGNFIFKMRVGRKLYRVITEPVGGETRIKIKDIRPW